MTIKTSVLKTSADIAALIEGMKNDDSEVRFYAYKVDGQTIHVESTTSNIMDEVTRLPVYGQTKMFAILAGLVPQVGDTELIVDDEGRKNRSGRVTRLKSEGADTINLLLTR